MSTNSNIERYLKMQGAHIEIHRQTCRFTIHVLQLNN